MDYIFWICLFMFVWFETDAFIWWAKLFKLNKILMIDNWDNYRITINKDIKYLDFVFIQKKSFFSKLISCKSCLLFWVCLFFSVLNGNIFELPKIYIFSYIIYSVFSYIIKKIS